MEWLREQHQQTLDQFIVQSEQERSGIRQELELALVEKAELEKAVESLQHETVRDKEERVRMLNEVPPLSLLRPRSAADCVLWCCLQCWVRCGQYRSQETLTWSIRCSV